MIESKEQQWITQLSVIIDALHTINVELRDEITASLKKHNTTILKPVGVKQDRYPAYQEYIHTCISVLNHLITELKKQEMEQV